MASPNWILPNFEDILDENNLSQVGNKFVERQAHTIEETLALYGAPGNVTEIRVGPTFTRFGVEPLFHETNSGRTRVRISEIKALEENLAQALSVHSIHIQHPISGRPLIGIGVPNAERRPVCLREVLESKSFQIETSLISFGLGRDIGGSPQIVNLEKIFHLLITGATGSGKSVCVHTILTSLLLRNTPADLRLILVDTKLVELSKYDGVPHLLAPTIKDENRVMGALHWVMREIDKRFQLFEKIGVSNIDDYNSRIKLQGRNKLPSLLIVIEELAELMRFLPDEIERTIVQLAFGARATGIHMIITTLQLSKDVLPDSIKDNFSARVTFEVTSKADSNFVLGQPGAERLLGQGDMLFRVSNFEDPIRVQGVIVSDAEIQRLVDFWRAQIKTSSF